MQSVLAFAFAFAFDAVLAASSYAPRPTASLIEPALTQIEAAAATATALSPVSNTQGAGFDRFVQIWLENTDFDKAAQDPNFQFLATQGITLTNYNAVTHPSQPNYAAVVAGDIFGLDNDDFIAVGNNISTVVDLLDTKGISWAEYQEDQPYPGFQGFNYSNQVTYANAYVRKHNPLIRFGSVNSNATRLSLIKNFTEFDSDLAAQTLPQWMFVTPNMTNDGHDTSVTVAGTWARNWLTPLLNNSYFMNNTLIILTFDENETYTTHNVIYTLLLGGAIPETLRNTTDNTFYNHYSAISSVSVNWDLPSLGRWDCDANVFQTVANKTNYENWAVDATNLFFNESYPGPLSDGGPITFETLLFYPGQFRTLDAAISFFADANTLVFCTITDTLSEYIPDWPTPNTVAKCASGKGVLSSIAATWGQSNGTYNYTNVYPNDALVGNNVGGTATLPSPISGSSSTPTSGASSTPSSSKGVTLPSTTSGSSTPTSGASSTPSSIKGGTKAGIAIAAVVGAFLLIGAAIAWWRRRRRHVRGPGYRSELAAPMGGDLRYKYGEQPPLHAPVELLATQPEEATRRQLKQAGGYGPSEMPS